MHAAPISRVFALVALVLGAPAIAAPAGGFVDYAEVVAVEPHLRTVRVSNPRQECWNETVNVRRAPAGRSFTPEIVGGILGAAVGNQFGGGSGRDIATVAGAVLGGSLGHDYKNRRQSAGYQQVVEERCRTVHDDYTEQRVDGYDVTYRYQGRTYSTRMGHDPGDSLRVRVAVSPIE